MLIDSVAGQECRIAILNDGKLEELYIERVSSASQVGNIYKGIVTNVEPSIQAAFIDFGSDKNGFLHISDLHPQYFPADMRRDKESVGHKHPHKDRPPIQECLRRGQEIAVQMTKEGIGTKGPTMTTYLSIPGRLLVMMPAMKRLGVSRKVEDDEARIKAREILSELKLPEDMGFIVRTAGIGQTKRELQRDLNYLTRLWRSTKKIIDTTKAPTLLYKESDLVIRTIRDIYNSSIDRIICDGPKVAMRVVQFLNIAMPRTSHNIEVYDGQEGLFYQAGLEAEIEKVYCRRVELPSGGSLVIDPTEALVAIDVNSGRSRDHIDAEATALNTNIEAAHEIARQLRLRDLGGVVVMDFIDMRDEKNRRKIEKVLRDEMKTDRAKSKVLKINNFGIIQMTRQRLGPPLKRSIYNSCQHCEGSGLIKSQESQALSVMRTLKRICVNENIGTIKVSVPPDVDFHLSNRERKEIAKLELRSQKTIIIESDASLTGGEINIACLNLRGSSIAWDHPIVTKSKKKKSKAKTKLPTKVFDLKKYKPSAEGLIEEDEYLDLLEEEEVIAEAVGPIEAPAEEKTDQAKPEEKAAKSGPKRARRSRRGGKKHRKKSAESTEQKSEGDKAKQEKDTKTEKPSAKSSSKQEVTDKPSEDSKKKPARKTSKKTAQRTTKKTQKKTAKKPAAKAKTKETTEVQKPSPKTSEGPKPEKPAVKKKSEAEKKYQARLKELEAKSKDKTPITFDKKKKEEKKGKKSLFEALGLK